MKIPGILLRPCTTSEEENEKLWRSSEFWTENNFFNEYSKLKTAQDHIVECAKIFILKNYKDVKNWNELKVTVEYFDNESGFRSEIQYGNFIDKGCVNNEIAKLLKDKILVENLTDVVLDPTDGDFSITINGKQLWWIDDDSIIWIADYIEERLRIQH